MKKLKMTMEFEVPDTKVTLFTKELTHRMHKFLATNSTKVTAVDTEVTTIKQDK